VHVEVRYVKEDDVEVVADMIARLKTLNEELDPHFKVVDNLEDETRNYVRESLGSSNVVMLLAYNASTGEPVGVVRLEIVDRIFYKPRVKAVITDIYVKPRYRRRRIATVLLEKAKEEARKRGAGIIVAVYPANNVIAEAFYEREGFKTLQVEKYLPL
jgi:ribosomal protein S18 acetylase RimI-like enzyme